MLSLVIEVVDLAVLRKLKIWKQNAQTSESNLVGMNWHWQLNLTHSINLVLTHFFTKSWHVSMAPCRSSMYMKCPKQRRKCRDKKTEQLFPFILPRLQATGMDYHFLGLFQAICVHCLHYPRRHQNQNQSHCPESIWKMSHYIRINVRLMTNLWVCMWTTRGI